MSYKYVNPIDNGFVKVKMSRKEIKNLIRNYHKYMKYEVYENENEYLIHVLNPLYIKIFHIFSFPISILLHGLLHIKDIFEDIYCVVFDKKTGNFLSETIWKNKVKQDSINETLDLIK